jgi:putative tricarboxylic transport membrane protein
MTDGILGLGNALVGFLDPQSLLYLVLASFLGLVVGALPGLTATMAIALLSSLTFTLPPSDAILILIAVYVGAIYGGSRTAILLNIPGTPASAATCLDGHALAKRGEAGHAMAISTSGSFLGTMIGIVCLAAFTPLLGEFALSFGAYEFFWLALFGVVISGTVAGGDPVKGWLAGLLGLLVACVGRESVHGYDRFTFGVPDLAGGIALIPAMVGAFGLAEILMMAREGFARQTVQVAGSVIPKIADVLRYWRTIIRSGLLGTAMGVIPGVGEDIGAWASYAAAKRASRERETFGKGSLEGLMAAETGNSAAVPGAIIPVLALAVPGSAPAAVLMAAMIIHGVRPGPMLMIMSPGFFYEVVATILLAGLAILVIGVSFVRPFVRITALAKSVLVPAIFILCVVGSFAIASRIFDVWIMLGFGVIGFALRLFGYPIAPLVLGLVLGEMLDASLRRGLVLSDGSLIPFFTRPISLALAIVTAASILLQVGAVRRTLGRATAVLPFRRSTPPPPVPEPPRE